MIKVVRNDCALHASVFVRIALHNQTHTPHMFVFMIILFIYFYLLYFSVYIVGFDRRRLAGDICGVSVVRIDAVADLGSNSVWFVVATHSCGSIGVSIAIGPVSV